MYYLNNDQLPHAASPDIILPVRTFRKGRKKFCFLSLFIILFAIHFPVVSFSATLNLPKDANGWTVFTPSADTRIMYVSATGNDLTGQVYSSASVELGIDPFNPSGSIQAFATYAAAYANTREGYPDWVLFKRGDSFYQTIGGDIRSGRGSTEPSLVGSYGPSGSSPVLMTSQEQSAIRRLNSSLAWAAFSGITFYAYTRDPNHLEYIDGSGVPGIYLRTGAYTTQGVLIEGCKFKFYPNNEIQHLNDTGGVDSVTLRRSVFLDNYNPSAHSQGIYINRATVDIDECIFDHNGWYSQAGSGGIGSATVFNHNIYLSAPKDVKITNTISLRPSSIHFKNATYSTTGTFIGPTITGNLLVDGEIGVSMWSEYLAPATHKDLIISENVLTNIGRSRPTNRRLSYYLDIANVDGAIIQKNILLNQTDLALSGFGINTRGYVQNFKLTGNVFHNLYNITALSPNFDTPNPNNPANVDFSNNIINMPTSSRYLVNASYDPSTAWSFSANKYFSSKTDGKRFRVAGVDKSDAEWATLTGDNSIFEQHIFPDPTRSIETYMVSIGENATIDAFIEKCRAQNRHNWDERFTAKTVNAWIKNGYIAEGIGAPAQFELMIQ